MNPEDCLKHSWEDVGSLPGIQFFKFSTSMTWDEFRPHVRDMHKLRCRHCGKIEYSETENRWVDATEKTETNRTDGRTEDIPEDTHS
jgi:hypothetical protein